MSRPSVLNEEELTSADIFYLVRKIPDCWLAFPDAGELDLGDSGADLQDTAELDVFKDNRGDGSIISGLLSGGKDDLTIARNDLPVLGHLDRIGGRWWLECLEILGSRAAAVPRIGRHLPDGDSNVKEAEHDQQETRQQATVHTTALICFSLSALRATDFSGEDRGIAVSP